MPISPSDAIILEALQENARVRIDVLAERTGLSPASVQRRLRRLREGRVLVGEVGLVDPAKVGRPLTLVVMVEMEDERADKLDAFQRAALREPLVQQCYYVTGAADFCLVCTARDMADYEAMTQRLFFEGGNVRRFTTSVVMRRAKVGLAVPAAPSRDAAPLRPARG
ncbi:Lrp/AsnC family transcriptional regulator [Salinarimonas sp.]|uniref:Lrp/AsnC family transcriptional regulator n=1 Tax=Salinarimonas sp. TaxID=2766526 RepID=UPI0032D933C9